MAVAGKKKIFDDKYEILSIVGRGSRSVVYHARNISDIGGEAALKVLIENKKDVLSNSEKLRREALAMVSSHHPYVVRLDDFHSLGDICYLSMEYAPEADLRKYVDKFGGRLPVDQGERVLSQACEALEYIHRVGIVHRDVKPDNILVMDENSIRMADFGVALLPGDDTNSADLRNAVGTMDYMAPEVLEGIEYNQRSDLYSLAISFYELLSGTHPFAHASLSEQLEVRRDGGAKPLIELMPEIPAYLSEAIQRAMAFDARDRFASAKEMLQHLKQKRIQKQPTPPKREERPQLKVVAGTLHTPEKASEPAQKPQEPTKFSEPESPEITQFAPKEPEVVEIPESNSAEPVISIQEPRAEEQNAGTPNMQPDSVILKDSRSSRNPTVFIDKESIEKLRTENEKPMRVAPRTIAPARQPRASVHPGQQNTFTVGIAAVAILLAVLGWNILSSRQTETVEVARTVANTDDSLLPQFDGEALSFPDLPPGVYVGGVKGMVPDVIVPMSIVSFAESSQLVVTLGLDGWSPATIQLDETVPEAIRVASNGFILEISGKAEGGVIKGSIRNIVEGSEAAFALRPAS